MRGVRYCSSCATLADMPPEYLFRRGMSRTRGRLRLESKSANNGVPSRGADREVHADDARAEGGMDGCRHRHLARRDIKAHIRFMKDFSTELHNAGELVA